MIPSSAQNYGLDTGEQLDPRSGPISDSEPDQNQINEPDVDEKVQAMTGKSVGDILQLVREAESVSTMFMQSYVRTPWERAYRAYRSEHFIGSKYLSTRFKGRSKLFRPKTRSAVRKNMAAAASALFATADVATVSAQDDNNQLQRASAELKQQLLNYRLDRANGKASIPWFSVSMGAKQDAEITGVCITKQYWKFKERMVDKEGNFVPRFPGETPPDIEYVTEVDRPDVINIMPENVLFDFNCEWTKPAQTSTYWIVRWPMPLADVREMIDARRQDYSPDWLDVTDKDLQSIASVQPDDTRPVRMAREGGQDRDISSRTGPFRIVWVYEVFLRINGEDFCFWTLGNQRLLSIPKPTRDAYPHLFGERPYALGWGALETHRPIPTSPVESWQNLQAEANDIANLRLDQMKHVVSPIAKVMRGKGVDLDALQRRSADTVLMMTDLKDVEWDRPPDVPPSAYQESQYINADFDDLTGSFNGGSVATNRKLNETVGGMKLLSGAANNMTEFDLRVWVESWAEPCLYQVNKLIEYYESDQKILEICGNRAQLFERFGVNQITDHMLMEDAALKIDIGLGAGDPMQQLQKFGVAANVFGQIITPFLQAGKVQVVPNVEEIADVVFGKAGYKDGGERFFAVLKSEPDPAQAQQGPPQKPTNQVEQAKVQLQGQKQQQDAQLTAAQIQSQERIKKLEFLDAEKERQTKFQMALLKAKTDMHKTVANSADKAAAARHELRGDMLQHALAREGSTMDRQHQLRLQNKTAASQAELAKMKVGNGAGKPNGSAGA